MNNNDINNNNDIDNDIDNNDIDNNNNNNKINDIDLNDSNNNDINNSDVNNNNNINNINDVSKELLVIIQVFAINFFQKAKRHFWLTKLYSRHFIVLSNLFVKPKFLRKITKEVRNAEV